VKNWNEKKNPYLAPDSRKSKVNQVQGIHFGAPYSSVVKNENERRQRWAKEIRKKKVQLKANGCTAQYSIIYSIQAESLCSCTVGGFVT